MIALLAVSGMVNAASSGSKPQNTATTQTTPAQQAAPTQASRTQAPAAAATPTPAPAQKFTTFGDGTHRVGADIQPGTYRTREGSPGCYFARLKGFSGGFGDIAANENTDAPAVITIDPGDAGFESTRCGTWTTDLSNIIPNAQTFGDGEYIIGTDVTPGTWKNSGSTGCYWARLSNFSHGFGAILANQNSDASTVVTIAADDKGFQATRCGTWSRVG